MARGDLLSERRQLQGVAKTCRLTGDMMARWRRIPDELDGIRAEQAGGEDQGGRRGRRRLQRDQHDDRGRARPASTSSPPTPTCRRWRRTRRRVKIQLGEHARPRAWARAPTRRWAARPRSSRSDADRRGARGRGHGVRHRRHGRRHRHRRGARHRGHRQEPGRAHGRRGHQALPLRGQQAPQAGRAGPAWSSRPRSTR